jgi:hypothetical protein
MLGALTRLCLIRTGVGIEAIVRPSVACVSNKGHGAQRSICSLGDFIPRISRGRRRSAPFVIIRPERCAGTMVHQGSGLFGSANFPS